MFKTITDNDKRKIVNIKLLIKLLLNSVIGLILRKFNWPNDG